MRISGLQIKKYNGANGNITFAMTYLFNNELKKYVYTLNPNDNPLPFDNERVIIIPLEDRLRLRLYLSRDVTTGGYVVRVNHETLNAKFVIPPLDSKKENVRELRKLALIGSIKYNSGRAIVKEVKEFVYFSSLKELLSKYDGENILIPSLYKGDIYYMDI